MIDLEKYGEKYMWRAHFGDHIVDEFYMGETDPIQTPFDEINQKEDFEHFELITNIESMKDVKIGFNKEGLFEIANKTYKFLLVDNEGNNLLSGPFNSLMMYRTDAQLMTSNLPVRYAYTIGYKINNDSIFARVKFITSVEGASFKLEITGKENMQAELIIQGDRGEQKQTISIVKDKTSTIEIN